MADEKKDAKYHDQETIQPADGQKDELSERDLDKASGGAAFEKWIELDKV